MLAVVAMLARSRSVHVREREMRTSPADRVIGRRYGEVDCRANGELGLPAQRLGGSDAEVFGIGCGHSGRDRPCGQAADEAPRGQAPVGTCEPERGVLSERRHPDTHPWCRIWWAGGCPEAGSAGALTVGSLSALISALIQLGMPEEIATSLGEHIHKGDALIIVHALNEEQAALARSVLAAHNPRPAVAQQAGGVVSVAPQAR